MLHPALSCIEGEIPSPSPWTERAILGNFFDNLFCSRFNPLSFCMEGELPSLSPWTEEMVLSIFLTAYVGYRALNISSLTL
jgi:hypothetical protein